MALTQKRLAETFSRPPDDLDLRVVMVDGIAFRDHCVLLALGIAADGTKHVLGSLGGLDGAQRRGQGPAAGPDRAGSSHRALLFVVDGSKALRKAVRDVFGGLALVHRCQIHKERNVLEHLPQALRPSVRRALRQAWASSSADLAHRQLLRLAASLDAEHPGAAASLREGLEETLTLLVLGIEGALYRTLRSTNPIENLNGSVADYKKNVKRWRGGGMILRWVGAAVVEASNGFRKIRSEAAGRTGRRRCRSRSGRADEVEPGRRHRRHSLLHEFAGRRRHGSPNALAGPVRNGASRAPAPPAAPRRPRARAQALARAAPPPRAACSCSGCSPPAARRRGRRRSPRSRCASRRRPETSTVPSSFVSTQSITSGTLGDASDLIASVPALMSPQSSAGTKGSRFAQGPL